MGKMAGFFLMLDHVSPESPIPFDMLTCEGFGNYQIVDKRRKFRKFSIDNSTINGFDCVLYNWSGIIKRRPLD